MYDWSKDSMKKFYEELREHAIKRINFKKKKNRSLKNSQQKSYKNAKFYYYCRETFKDKYAAGKKHQKVRHRCQYTCEYKGAVHSKSYLKI